MNRVIRAMHRKVMAIESMLEVPKSLAEEAKEDPALGPQPPEVEVPKTPENDSRIYWSPEENLFRIALKVIFENFRTAVPAIDCRFMCTIYHPLGCHQSCLR